MNVSFIRRGQQGWFLYYHRLDDKSGQIIGMGSVKADRVILSAGVLGTSEILMRSQEHGLKLSKQLGAGVSANGDDLAFGHDMPQEVNGIAVGHPGREKTSRASGTKLHRHDFPARGGRSQKYDQATGRDHGHDDGSVGPAEKSFAW